MIDDISLLQVDGHWAVLAIGETERDRGLKVVDAQLVKRAVGQQLDLAFPVMPTDQDTLQRLALAYEMAAIEGLPALMNAAAGNEQLRQQCIAGAWRAFDFRRLFELPSQVEERVFHVLHLSALAYCGDRWSDLRRWYNELDHVIQVPSVADATWDHRLLYRLFECWIRLFRKRRWDDLDRIREIIAGLREDQATYEPDVLGSGSNAEDRAMALRLIALYHWAKATEYVAVYMLQGEPTDIASRIDKHFEAGEEAAAKAHDARLEILLRWLHAASRQMIAGSLWWVARAVNSRVTRFVKHITKQQGLFELLPPQRAALQEKGLLDAASTAIVIEMPTSGGKTLLAQFRILQALNQFDADKGWVAYVAPTRALTAQITRRLRRDFEPIGIRVEQLSGAVEVDAFEEDLLSGQGEQRSFDILVATPEKLQLVIRNQKVTRPLALVVMDEAHNIENASRGMRIELLLATIKRECNTANFLLMMPYVANADTLTRWLAQDANAGRTISIGTTPWKPNERIVGMFKAVPDDSITAGWRLTYQTLTTTPNTIHLDGVHWVGQAKPLPLPKSALNLGIETAAMAHIFSERGTSIAIATRIDSVWKMARKVCQAVPALTPIPDEIRLVQRFLQTEISSDFELIDMLSRGVGVHHAGLSDEVRALIEWLAEEGKLRTLCATTTIAQGINFPVSSLFLSSRSFFDGHQSKEMSPREFWNMAGRAGRIDHDSVGVVGIAAGTNPAGVMEFVSRATGELVSRLVTLLDELEQAGRLQNLTAVIHSEQWEDFRCYVAHLWNEKRNIDAVLAETEQLLRNTYGYGVLRGSRDGEQKARVLLEATKEYARQLAEHPGHAQLADMTGFSPEGVAKALAGLGQLQHQLTVADWSAESLFGRGNGLAELYGIMLKIPQLASSLEEIGGTGRSNTQIASITNAWVSGKSIKEIADTFFQEESGNTEKITEACKAIYRYLVNTGPWGLSALCRMSGIDFEALSEDERRRINTLPAMIYHGVSTEEAVLMRMNSVPRSVAERVGQEYRSSIVQPAAAANIRQARTFLKGLDAGDWERVRPTGSHLSGSDFKTIWELLSGERR